jgi:hypothetical protein
MPVIEAQDIVNAVIQDSQSQTTNRSALYDYTDRIHQRILRESQWRFLLSDPQVFVTMPGVSSYTLVSGTPPAGSFQTNNLLTNFANIAPGSVYNLTTNNKLEEDTDDITSLSYFRNLDGSLRSGYPRTYSNSIANPGTIFLKPVPDDQNQYYPVPETPVVTFTAGGTLPARIYYGVVTFVDSLQGESTQCEVPFVVSVPAGYLATIHSPNSSIGGISGNQTLYNFWNVYIGYAVNNYSRQNSTPTAIGTNWTENALGIMTGTLPVPSVLALQPASSQTVLSISENGLLTTTNTGTNVYPFYWALEDTNGNLWQIQVNSGTGQLQAVALAPNPSTVNVYTALYLTDTSDYATWAITVTTIGQLQASVYSVPPATIAVNGGPPLTSTIQPLNAYAIHFRYYQSRSQITSSNPTQALQVPYAYKDIVIAGVNYLAGLYMDRLESREPSAKTLSWKRDFDQGLAQIRRDLRINYRKTDFISPDSTSQYQVSNNQGIPTMGW